ncbi:hypothetical protein F383_23314 [Gossypium arboreum]|uniref:Uncharacterized protein n=1 Tax=Gossypium arboreum TaxID=29729 RepID=A0A0B0NVN3_GOSAR|nr:hypothetical protein F383_23314 [Gossypium arboreum]
MACIAKLIYATLVLESTKP